GEIEDVHHETGSFTYSTGTLRHYPNLDPTGSDLDTPSLIHLNGIAGYVKPQDWFKTGSVFQKKFREDLKSTLRFMADKTNNYQIHFAWEKIGYHETLLKHVRSMIAGTTILVVVGYSFPFFNREIDKLIFEQLKDGGLFRKIYFQ